MTFQHRLGNAVMRLHEASLIDPESENKRSTTGATGKEEVKKRSSFLSPPSNLGISNILFGNDDSVKKSDAAAVHKAEKGEKTDEVQTAGSSKRFPASVSQAFKRTREGLGSTFSAQEEGRTFSPFGAKKRIIKFDENLPEACEVLTLIEICLMHGIRVKEYHGALPFWTLLERVHLQNPDINNSPSSSSDVSGGDDRKADVPKNAEGNYKNDKKNTSSKDSLMASFRNKLDNFGHNSDGNKKNNDNEGKSVKRSSKSGDAKQTEKPSVPRRTHLRAAMISGPSSFPNALAKARAWIR